MGQLWNMTLGQLWWLVCAFDPSMGKQRQKDLSEFQVCLVYKVSPKSARLGLHREAYLKRKKKKYKLRNHIQYFILNCFY